MTRGSYRAEKIKNKIIFLDLWIAWEKIIFIFYPALKAVFCTIQFLASGQDSGVGCRSQPKAVSIENGTTRTYGSQHLRGPWPEATTTEGSVSFPRSWKEVPCASRRPTSGNTPYGRGVRGPTARQNA